MASCSFTTLHVIHLLPRTWLRALPKSTPTTPYVVHSTFTQPIMLIAWRPHLNASLFVACLPPCEWQLATSTHLVENLVVTSIRCSMPLMCINAKARILHILFRSILYYAPKVLKHPICILNTLLAKITLYAVKHAWLKVKLKYYALKDPKWTPNTIFLPTFHASISYIFFFFKGKT